MLLTLLACLPLLAQETAPADPRALVREAYNTAWTKRDSKLLAQTWRDNPQYVLATFDADLEAGLASWEAKNKGHEARTKDHFDRAVWAAEIAADVLDRPIFGDYASAFAGWNKKQRSQFRRGQAAFGAANRALREGDSTTALVRAIECREAAIELGDWWGTAMGMTVEAAAQAKIGNREEAIVLYSRARLLNHQLGLRGSEYRVLLGLVDALVLENQHRRAMRAAKDALVMARKNKDIEGERSLLIYRRTCERALRLDSAAAVTEKELERLGKSK